MLEAWIFYLFAYAPSFVRFRSVAISLVFLFVIFSSLLHTINFKCVTIKVSCQCREISTWIANEKERKKGKSIGYTYRKWFAVHMIYLCEFVDNLSSGDSFYSNHSMTHLICCCIRSTWHYCRSAVCVCVCVASSWANRILTNEMEYPPEIGIRSKSCNREKTIASTRVAHGHICISYVLAVECIRITTKDGK